MLNSENVPKKSSSSPTKQYKGFHITNIMISKMLKEFLVKYIKTNMLRSKYLGIKHEYFYILQKIFFRFATDSQKIFKRVSQDLYKICTWFAKDLQQICKRFAIDLQKACKIFSKDWQQSCKRITNDFQDLQDLHKIGSRFTKDF